MSDVRASPPLLLSARSLHDHARQSRPPAPLVSELLAALLHVQAPPPLPQAHAGKRTDADGNPLAASPTRERPAPSDDGASEGLPLLRKVLADVLDGTSQAPRLGHALEDLDLARRIGDLVAEHRSYRAILQRIGVLPKA